MFNLDIKREELTNTEISKKLKLAIQIMELHGENPFKLRSYQSGREVVSSLSYELKDIPTKDIVGVEGIGKSLAGAIEQMLSSGSFDKLDSLLEVTPEGVIEMIKIPGFGPKKIATLWKDAEATTLEEVQSLCKAGKVSELKGFGAKTQDSLSSAVNFIISCRGKEKYANVEPRMLEVLSMLEKLGSVENVSVSGAARRKLEVLESIQLLVSSNDFEMTRVEINAIDTLSYDEKQSGPFTWVGHLDSCSLPIQVKFCSPEQYAVTLFTSTATVEHLTQMKKIIPDILDKSYSSEQEVYQSNGFGFVEPELREGRGEVEKSQSGNLPELLQMSDLKGILHNHSTYSDGKHTLRQMAEHCKDLGYEYLGITDHSQTAVYANGLDEVRVKKQQEEIVQLNEELAPFKVFSGIESDILANGSLDYSDDVLSSFDFIVSSIHSGLSMDKTKATNRLLKAIHNPYTTILGHMTGRLILEREGYPVDHKAIIDACAETGVVIEINASPYRLDIDWRWVDYAMEKEVVLSINPDAHRMEGYQGMKYGVYAGRKGGLTKEMTLNAKSLQEIEQFFESRKKK